MSSSTNVNKKTTVHAGSGGQAVAFPDMCKTPAPPAPVPPPMPYPNKAASSDAASTTSTVKVDGNPICVEGSNFALSTGDEAGVAQGVTSSKIKGKAEFTNQSSDVTADGKAVTRLSDPMKQNDGNVPTPAELQAPVVAVGSDDEKRAKACAALPKPAKNTPFAAFAAGMLKGDLEAISRVCRLLDITLTFRDTNRDCLKPLAGNKMKSKDHSVTTKTFSSSNLLPEDQDLAGKVSTLKDKPDPGVIIDNPRSKLHPANLTGDYDMMDMFDGKGNRIEGESPNDHRIRAALNASLPNGGDPPRIMHGCQSAYPDYLKSPAGQHETPEPKLFRPEAPLTVFSSDGSVTRLETMEDVMNYYTCKGSSTPKEWGLSK